MYTNVFFKDKNDETKAFQEATVAIDPTGFLVIEAEGKRLFINLEEIKEWGYDYTQEEQKEPDLGKLFSIEGGKDDPIN